MRRLLGDGAAVGTHEDDLRGIEAECRTLLGAEGDGHQGGVAFKQRLGAAVDEGGIEHLVARGVEAVVGQIGPDFVIASP